MGQMMKRLTAFLLAVAMCMSLLCSSAWAADGLEDEDTLDTAVEELIGEEPEEADGEESAAEEEVPAETPVVDEILEAEPEVSEKEADEEAAFEEEPEEEATHLNNGDDTSTVLSKLSAMSSTYPSGSYFSKNGSACTHAQSSTCTNCQLSYVPARGGYSTGSAASAVTGDGWTCCAFARYVFYNLFKLKPTASSNSVYTSISSAKPGDYIICYNSSGSIVHYAIFVSLSGSTMYLYESNYGTPNKVMYKSSYKTTNWSSYKIYHASNYPQTSTAATVSYTGDVCTPSKTDAYVYTKAVATASGNFTKAGIRVYDSTGAVVASKDETVNYTRSDMEIWYNITSETGVKLTSGMTYTYKMYCVFNGTTYWTASKTLATVYDAANNPKPATPLFTTRTNQNGSVYLQWGAVSGATGYRLYRKTENGSWEVLANQTGTTYTDTSIPVQGEVYYYTVRAYKGTYAIANTQPYGSSCWSEYTSQAWMYLAPPALGSAASNASGISVSWSGVTGAAGYYVYRKSGSSDWMKVGTVTGTSYVDTAIENGVTYVYTVRAYNGSYLSDFNATGVSALGNTKIDLSKSVITTPSESYVYTGSARKPGVTVTYNGTKLANGRDYTITYSNNINVGTGTITVTGTGNYTGTATKRFTITARDISECTVTTPSTRYIYTGKTRNPGVTVKYGSVTLKKGTDYTVTYSDNIAIGTGKITITGMGNFTGTKVKNYEIVPAAPVIASFENTSLGIKLTWGSVAGAKTYGVFRMAEGESEWTKLGTTAGLTYKDTGAKAGVTYQYCLKAYNGSIYSDKSPAVKLVRLEQPAIASVSNAAAGTLTVKWSAISGVGGYQVDYSTSSTFKNYTRVKIADSSKTSAAISGLTKGTKYYVRLRTYKTVSGVASYSYWSSVKTITVMK